jgi:hypothetical protein
MTFGIGRKLKDRSFGGLKLAIGGLELCLGDAFVYAGF